MTKKANGFVRTICLGLSLLAVASCSVLGASLDPLANGGADGGAANCAEGGCAQCPPDQTACGTQCVVTTNDPLHCGNCTTACNPGDVCGDGRCSANCPAEQTNCNGSCTDTQTDSKNCGVCGQQCGDTDECIEGKCVVSCKSMLNQPVSDPWGWSWDGLERAASTFSIARSTCADFRGRLPTPSELYRVSATQSGTIGQTLHTNPLWSLAPASPGVHVRVRLSDAAISSTDADATKTNYRCVCPPKAPKTFVAQSCNGIPNSNACAQLDGEGGRYNIDTKDRPAVPKTAALWECAFNNAHLPTAVQLAEAIQQNIGAGTGNWLHSADEIKNDLSVFANWTDGKDFVFEFNNNKPNSMAANAPTAPFPFRCIGESAAPPALPLPAGQWSATGRRNLDAGDQPAAKFIDAVAHCFEIGGHLPTIADLNELVLQGAPDGTGTFLWTSDQTGANTAIVAKWTGVQLDHLYGGADMNWGTKSDAKPYRCAYYAVDPAYGGPPAASCSGGCTVINSPGTNGAKSWFDSTDRPQANVTVAIDTCRKLGGHLPSERDFIEAIRAALPNGSDAYLQTSDAMVGNGSFQLLVGTVKWKDTLTDFDDAWATRSSWGYTNDAKPFRCMWTNELR